MTEYPYEYIHTCGEPAFYLKQKPAEGGKLLSADIALLDGSQPAPHDLVCCGSCGVHLGRLLSKSVQEGLEVYSD